mgnify:CR=1 FL=1
MRGERNYLPVWGVVFVLMVAAMFAVHRWVTKEISHIGPSAYQGASPAPDDTLSPVAAVRPQRVVIDPLSDPLAPVVGEEIPAPSRPSIPKHKDAERFYEKSLDDVILIQ